MASLAAGCSVAERRFPSPLSLALILHPRRRRRRHPSRWRPAVSPSPPSAKRFACGVSATSARSRGRAAIGWARSSTAARSRYVRNPLYLGNIALWVGFALIARLVWLAPVLVSAARLRVSRDRAVGRRPAGSRVWARPIATTLARVPRWIPMRHHAVPGRTGRPRQIFRRRQQWPRAFRGATRSSANAARSSRSWSGTDCSGSSCSDKARATRRLCRLFLCFRSVCHRYHDATDRYGRHASPIFSIRFASGRLRRRIEPLHRR